MKSNWLKILPLIVIGILCLCLNRQCNTLKEVQNSYRAANDDLNKVRNRLGAEKATTKLIISDYKQLKRLSDGKDSSIVALKKLVDRHTLSATVGASETGNSVSLRTDTLVFTDTVIYNDTVFLFPEYYSAFSNKWERFNIKASKDTITLDYTVFNEFSIEQTYKRDGWFKPKYPVVIVNNNNPNTTTTSLKSFNVKPKKANRLVWFVVGGVAGIIAARSF